MQDIGIVSNAVPAVSHSEGSPFVYLTFRGLRESRTIADRDTQIRITLPTERAAELIQMLSAALSVSDDA